MSTNDITIQFTMTNSSIHDPRDNLHWRVAFISQQILLLLLPEFWEIKRPLSLNRHVDHEEFRPSGRAPRRRNHVQMVWGGFTTYKHINGGRF